MPLDVWVASIPFTETRNYVQRVLPQVVYEWRYTGEVTRLDQVAIPQITYEQPWIVVQLEQSFPAFLSFRSCFTSNEPVM